MRISIQHQEEMRFVATDEQHKLTIDLPVPHGGTNRGMTPPHLFVASLGACVGVYIVDFCEENEIEYQDFRIDVDWVMQMKPKRIKRINMTLDFPNHSLTERSKQQIIDSANNCVLQNTLEDKPQVILTIPDVDYAVS